MEWSWQDCPQKEAVCFLPQGYPGPGDAGARQAWVLVPKWVALAAAGDSGKNSDPGWPEPGAVVREVSDRSEGQTAVCSVQKRDFKIIVD